MPCPRTGDPFLLREVLSTVHISRPVYLSAAEAAAFVGLNARTLANYRSARVGPPYRKVGSRVLYRLDDLIEYVEAGLVEPAV